MSKNEAQTLKTVADAYGISTKTFSKRLKELFPAKKGKVIRLLFPKEIEKIEEEYGKIPTA